MVHTISAHHKRFSNFRDTCMYKRVNVILIFDLENTTCYLGVPYEISVYVSVLPRY